MENNYCLALYRKGLLTLRARWQGAAGCQRLSETWAERRPVRGFMGESRKKSVSRERVPGSVRDVLKGQMIIRNLIMKK